MNMRVFSLVSLLLVSIATGQQSNKQPNLNPYNIPDELRTCLRAKPGLEIDAGVNPFYISADFDGDGFTDFAAQVQTKKDQRQGILFCLTKGGPVLLGAGAPVVWPQDDSETWPFDSWILIPKGSKHLSIYPQIRFDALVLIKADEGGGLIYWDGRKFRWQQEE